MFAILANVTLWEVLCLCVQPVYFVSKGQYSWGSYALHIFFVFFLLLHTGIISLGNYQAFHVL